MSENETVTTQGQEGNSGAPLSKEQQEQWKSLMASAVAEALAAHAKEQPSQTASSSKTGQQNFGSGLARVPGCKFAQGLPKLSKLLDNKSECLKSRGRTGPSGNWQVLKTRQVPVGLCTLQGSSRGSATMAMQGANAQGIEECRTAWRNRGHAVIGGR